MKKFIILMLLMLSTIPFVNLRAEIVTQEYDLTYTHGYWYDLYDGNFEANPNFSITNRNKILKGSLILDDLTSFHHLIYFDKNNQMIGYMNTSLTEIETPLFIDNITTFTPDIPTNAVYFALMGFYPYLNNTPIPEINNLTLGQIFGGTYDLANYYNLYYDDDYLDVSIAELNNHTLREVFEDLNRVIGVGKNLFDKSSIVAGSYYNSSGILVSNATSEYGNSFIRVNPNTTYTGNKAMLITTYDLQQNFISRISITNTFTTGSNVYYIIPSHLAQGLGYLETFQLELGSTATSYVPYKTTENNDLPPFVNWFGQDFFGISSLTVTQMDYWFALYQSIKNNSIIVSNGVTTPDNINYYYYNTDYDIIYSLYQLQNDSVYSPIYGDTFDALSSVQKLAQMNRWAQYPHELLDFADLNWFPTQTELTNYYTLFQNNILFDDYYFDDIEITITQPIVSYSYDRDVDNRGIVDYINDFMDDLGIGNPMAKFSISLILIVIVMVILWLVKAPSLLVIMGGLLMLIMFIIFGWVPIYIIVIVSAVLFYLIATNKGGNQDA